MIYYISYCIELKFPLPIIENVAKQLFESH